VTIQRRVAVLLLIGLVLAPLAAHARTPEQIRQRADQLRRAMGNPLERFERAGANTVELEPVPEQTVGSGARQAALQMPVIVDPEMEEIPGGELIDPGQGELIDRGDVVLQPGETIVEGGGMYFDEPYCDDGACGSCDSCWGGGSCVQCLIPLGYDPWVRADYLLWWTKGADYPPLVTTSDAGTVRDDAGVLGLATTSILFGDTGYNADTRSGFRFTVGEWFGPCRQFGLEGGYLTLGEVNTSFRGDQTTFPILARPFFNVRPDPQPAPAAEDAQLIAFPAVFDGSLAVDLSTEFQGAHVMMRRALLREFGFSMDVLTGWRYGRLEDTMRITQGLTVLDDPPVAPGTTVDLYDLFETTNNFNGVELGFEAEYRRHRWTLQVISRLALGNTRSKVFIDGQTTTTAPGGAPNTVAAGLLALPSNMGTYEKNHFSVMPELGINLHYDVTCRLRATVGYSFVYWSQVARPGDQIDRSLNLTQIPPGVLAGPALPQFSMDTTDFWAQGVNFGLEYRY